MMMMTDSGPEQQKRVRIVSFLRRETGLLAFLTVIITYFGVNYLMPGMHSYA